IPLLADHFLTQICGEMGIPVKKITPEAIDELKKFEWTGNIREFRNVLERLIILGGDKITASDVKTFATPYEL
ncbi:MAG: sigma-54-dependent Fis family transcriptional regulator, partial [Bacteroidales bacterium]|nr:sigma-54-dependent Fis family transcriptional regulator [Bacteroidales bacterium]